MFEFQYHLPVNLIFGRGKSEIIGREAAKYGKKVLLVTGGNSTKRSGLLARVKTQLEEIGMGYVVFDKVTPNPMTTTVYDGARAAVNEGCEVVIGIGGGSSIDAAKGIAFQAVNKGDINDYIFGRKLSDKALPVIAVPTTCGTGSEGNGFAVLTNPVTMDKKSLRCNSIVPVCSIIDPVLMTTMPKATLASVGFDALCHCMEAYLSSISQPITSLLALEGISLVSDSITAVYQDPSDLDNMEKLTLASTFGGMAINTAGVAATHGLEHPVSGLRDVVHGRGLAALTPIVFSESINYARDKFAVISKLIGGKDETDCVDKIIEMQETLNLRTTLSGLGITEQDVEWLTDNCIKVSAASLSNHPVVFKAEQIRKIYLKAI